MIEVELKGIDKAIRRFDDIISFIVPGALYGINESIELLENKIVERATQEGQNKYAESVTKEMNWVEMYGIVGPSVEFAPVDEMGDVSRYIHARCPWWRYLTPRLRKRVVSFPMLREVWVNNRDTIRDIIVKNIKEWIK